MAARRKILPRTTRAVRRRNNTSHDPGTPTARQTMEVKSHIKFEWLLSLYRCPPGTVRPQNGRVRRIRTSRRCHMHLEPSMRRAGIVPLQAAIAAMRSPHAQCEDEETQHD